MNPFFIQIDTIQYANKTYLFMKCKKTCIWGNFRVIFTLLIICWHNLPNFAIVLSWERREIFSTQHSDFSIEWDFSVCGSLLLSASLKIFKFDPFWSDLIRFDLPKKVDQFCSFETEFSGTLVIPWNWWHIVNSVILQSS